MHDLMDEVCANELSVSVETYVEKIEKTTMKRSKVIIGAIFSEDKNLIKKAKRIFNLIN